MERFFGLNRKGQGSIEFILLVAIAMIYVSTIIMPSVEVAKRATDDVMQLSQTRLAAEKLSNTIDAVAAASGGAKTTITILVPARAQVKCLNCDYTATPLVCIDTAPFNTIGFDFWLTENDQTPLLENLACPKEIILPGKSVCSKLFQTISEFKCVDVVNAQRDSIGDPDPITGGVPTIAEISIEKKTGEIVVTIP